jgi:hypothetical protein
MGKNVKVIYKEKWAWGWGIFLLLVAALVLSNQLGGFVELGVWSIIVSALALLFLVQCIVHMSFAPLPIPLAALYYIFQTPINDMFQINLPEIAFWPLALVSVLVTVGLFMLIPKRRFRKKNGVKILFGNGDSEKSSRIIDEVGQVVDEAGQVVGEVKEALEDEFKVKESGDDNNPRISVQFGGVSRYLHADSLETADLDCSFGSLEVYFDHVKLCPKGAEAFISCKFGAIELYVPSHWRVLDNMSASLGGVDIKGRRDTPDENAPQLKITGNVSFGAVEVHRI